MKTKFFGLTGVLSSAAVTAVLLASASDLRADDFPEQFIAAGCHATGGASNGVVAKLF